MNCWLILCLETWGMKRPRGRLLEVTTISCYPWRPLKELTFSLFNGLATASPVLHLVHIWHGFHCLFHLGCTSLNKNFIFSLQLPWFCQPWLLMPTIQAIKRLWKVSIKQILKCALWIPVLREAKFGMCRTKNSFSDRLDAFPSRK